jgi:hypothetical protein
MIKKEVNNKFDYTQVIGYFAIVIIIISLIGIGANITGRVTDLGTVNLTVEQKIEINFTVDNINFGSGQVTGGASNATLQSNLTGNALNGNWTQPGADLLLVNNGNVNVSIELSTTKNSTTMIGGTGPEYQYSIRNNELTSCNGSQIGFGGFNDVNKTSPGTMICDSLNFRDDKDSVNITIRIVIPSDAASGVLGDIITATGTAC